MIARLWGWACHPRRTLVGIRFRLLTRRFALPVIPLQALAPDDPAIEPPIMEQICLPPFHGVHLHDDYTPLLKIVRSVQPHVVLELGTAHGNTVANICNQLPDCRVWTVNAPAERMTGDITTYSLDENEIGCVYRQYGFADRVVQILENTLNLDLSRYFDEPCVDLAIIDACHDIDYVLNDFRKVEPFVRPGGLVLFHDTYPTRTAHTWTSYEACMRLRQRGFDIRLVDGTWWGVWRKHAPLTAAAPVRYPLGEPAPALPNA
jgi:predicted O-methyltransferase YrrM